MIKWNHLIKYLLFYFLNLISFAKWSISYLISNHFSFLFRVWTRKKYFAMKVLFVPFKNWEFRKKWTRADAYTYKIWWCWKKKKEKISFIHDLCKWSISFSFSFFDSWFQKNIIFLGRQKEDMKKRKERSVQIELCDHLFSKDHMRRNGNGG